MSRTIVNPEIVTYFTNEEIRRVNEENARILEALAAAAAGIFALILADRMFDIGEDAINKEYEIRDRIFAVQEKYITHWTDVTVPQAELVCGVIYGLTAPTADYSGVLSDISSQGDAVVSGADTGIDTLNIKNRVDCGQRECTNDAIMAGPVAVTQASHYVFRHQERRRYDMDDEYRRFASSTFRGLETKPDQVFALMGNAASLYGAIGQAALQQASSAASIAGGFFGYAAGALS